MSTRSTGDRGEAVAEAFLLDNGWQILDRNPHLRFSEIDILARDGRELVIVEVKAKSSSSFGFAVEQVTATKKRRLARLAELVQQGYNQPVRVDVIAIDDFGKSNQKIVHYKNALE